MTNKERKQMRDRIFEINVRLGQVADKLEADKRSMTKDEQDEVSALKTEKEILELRSNQMERPRTKEELSNERAFGAIVSAVYRHKEVPEEYRSIVHNESGKVGIEIPLNRDASGIQDNATVTDTIVPLTIGDIIQPLEKGLILDQLGMKFQYGMEGAWRYPIVAGVEATIEGENVEVSDTTIDISKIEPKPKRVSIAIPVSNRAIDQSSNLILDIVKTQIPLAVSRLLNRWMFSKTRIVEGASDGCFVAPKTALTGEISWDNVVALEGSVMSTGIVPDGTAAYVCSAKTYAKLKTTKKDAGSGLFLLQDGRMNGYPVYITEYVGDDILGFGVFNYELVGQFGKVRLLFDPYTGAKKNLVYFVFNTDFDMLTLRSEAFGVLTTTTTTRATTSSAKS